MISWLHFCAGISVSYSRLLDITQDLANRTLHQYERDGFKEKHFPHHSKGQY